MTKNPHLGLRTRGRRGRGELGQLRPSAYARARVVHARVNSRPFALSARNEYPGTGVSFSNQLANSIIKLGGINCLPLFGAKFTGSRSNRNRHCFVRQLSERNSRRREIRGVSITSRGLIERVKNSNFVFTLISRTFYLLISLSFSLSSYNIYLRIKSGNFF